MRRAVTRTDWPVERVNESERSFNLRTRIGCYDFADIDVITRRAGQPEAKAVLPIDAEDERVVDALVHRKTAERAETPLLGPHSGTVADLVRRMERWERWLASDEFSEENAIREEIRAERAGRKEP